VTFDFPAILMGILLPIPSDNTVFTNMHTWLL
jgi:hypothetical protein